MRNWKKPLLVGIMCLIVASMFLGVSSASEFRRTFLLEVDARYEISVKVRTDLDVGPTLASVYITTENGEYLRSTQMSRSLAGANQWQDISVLVTAPPTASHATVVITAPEGTEMHWDDLNIRRVEQEIDSEDLIQQGLVYTGLIVDSRDLDLQRGMSPRIYSESGQLIYAGVAASYEFIQEAGVATYGQDLTPDLLRRIEPTGKSITVSPLVVNALEVTGPTETGVIISDHDAQTILNALDTYDFLSHYSVIFLVD